MQQKVSTWFLLSGLFIVCLCQPLEAQNNTNISSKKISCPEKWWAVKHPFIAKKAFHLTLYSLAVADSLRRKESPGDNIGAGQLDAFKHAFWMATLVQDIKWKKAKRLGIAHEKANYRSYIKSFKKGIMYGHDRIRSEMDLWNNEIGIAIGLACKGCDHILLKQIILDSIQDGSMKVVRMNSKGQFLDHEGKILPPENYQGKWLNDKCLIPSNYKTDSET
jgi:hypothetical protein